MNDKEIAKEILLAAMTNDYLRGDDFLNVTTTIDIVCEAYKKILKAVMEG